MIDKKSIFITPENSGEMAQDQVVGNSFEDFGEGDESTTWWASDFMEMLGYPDMNSFSKVIRRAQQACLSAEIDVFNDFIGIERVMNSQTINDYKLTRFACYMVAMNGDIKKPQVASAQVFFARVTERVNAELEGANDVDRLVIRKDISDTFKTLSAAAKKVGVRDFAIFHDAGYKGMYNMGVKQLCKHKGVPKDLYDYMGKAELSANLFRMTMTEEKLKVRNVTNGHVANEVHKDVGKGVRKMVYESTGKFPENLPIERKLNAVSKQLKKANKELNKKK